MISRSYVKGEISCISSFFPYNLPVFSKKLMFQIIYIIVCVLFIAVVLLQQKNSSLGSMMGGGSGDEIVQTRRGAEKFLHRATVVLAVAILLGGLYAMMQ